MKPVNIQSSISIEFSFILYFFTVLFLGCDNSKEKTNYVNDIKDTITFPFEYSQIEGNILLRGKVLLRGTPIKNKKFTVDTIAARIMFDTGAFGFVLDKEFVSTKKMLFKCMDVENPLKEKNWKISNPVYFQIENYTFSSSNSYVSSIKNICGYKIDAIVGHSFFQNGIVWLNFDSKQLKFFVDPEFYEVSDYSKHKLFYENDYYYLVVEIVSQNKQFTGKLRVDLGFPGAILLNPVFQQKKLEFEMKKGVGYFLKFAGSAGSSSGILTRVDKIKIDNYSLSSPLVFCPDTSIVLGKYSEEDGLVGTSIFERFNVIMDLHNKFIYLKPRENFSDLFGISRLGFFYVDRRDIFQGWLVTGFYKSSHVENSGLRVNDIIQKINGFKTNSLTDSLLIRLLNEDTLNLSIKRNNRSILSLKVALKEYL